MFFNQQLTRQRALRFVAPRLWVLVAFVAASLLLVACKSAPAEQASAPMAAAPSAPSEEGAPKADDLTATEAAIAAMNEMQPSEPPAQTYAIKYVPPPASIGLGAWSERVVDPPIEKLRPSDDV